MFRRLKSKTITIRICEDNGKAISNRLIIRENENISHGFACAGKYIAISYPKELKHYPEVEIKNEVWRPIAGTNGFYHVSNTRKVKSFRVDKNGVILKGGSGKVQFCTPHNHSKVDIDDLVASAFGSNKKNL